MRPTRRRTIVSLYHHFVFLVIVVPAPMKPSNPVNAPLRSTLKV